MLRNIIFIGIVIFFSGCKITEVTKVNRLSSTVKIISVNLHHTLNSKFEVTKFVKKIKNLNPEILLVQQIGRPGYGGGFDAVKELSRQLEMRQYFAEARDDLSFSSGNAIFSIYPIMQSAIVKLSNPKKKIQYSAAFGVIDVGVSSLAVISTELVNNSSENRVIQFKELNSFISKNNAFPILLAGDFYEKNEFVRENKLVELMNSEGINKGEISNDHFYFSIKRLEIESAEEIFKDCHFISLKVIQ